MSNLESTRAGWIFRGIGVFFALVAAGLTVLDFITGTPALALVNIITLVAGATNFHFGTKMIRTARDHHQFMECHRAEMTRLRGELGES